MINQVSFRPYSLKLCDIHINYGNETIIEHPKIKLEAGKIFLLSGNNGSGKSSLLKLMAGLNKKAGTRYLYENNRLTQNINLIFYLPSQIPFINEFNCFKVTTILSLLLQDFKDIASKNKIHTAITQNLYKKSTIQTLSTGQAQFLLLQSMFNSHKPIWILDEPEQHLDADKKELLCQKISSHISRNGLVCIASHDINLYKNHPSLKANIDHFKLD